MDEIPLLDFALVLLYRIVYLLTTICYYGEHPAYLRKLDSFYRKSIITKSAAFKSRKKITMDKRDITFMDFVNKEYSFKNTYIERQDYVYATRYGNPNDPLDLRLNFSPTVEPFTRTPSELIEDERRRSFNNFRWLQTLNATVEDLVRDGFYCTGDSEIRCCHCDLFYPYRSRSDDVEAIHQRLSPNCPRMRRRQGQRGRQAPLPSTDSENQERCGWADCEQGTSSADTHFADNDSVVIRRTQLQRTHGEGARGNAEDTRGINSRNAEGYISAAALPVQDQIHNCKVYVRVGNCSKMIVLRNLNVEAEIVKETSMDIFIRFRTVIPSQNYLKYFYAVIDNTVGQSITFSFNGVQFKIEVRGYPPYLWIKIRENN